MLLKAAKRITLISLSLWLIYHPPNLPTPTNTKTQTMPSTETYKMWVFFVSDMQNLINGPNVKVILVGWVKLNGQKMLLLVGQAHLLSEINILCEWGKT